MDHSHRKEGSRRSSPPPPPPPLTDTSPLSLSLSLSKSPVSPHLSSSPHTMKSNCRVCCLLPPSPPPKKDCDQRVLPALKRMCVCACGGMASVCLPDTSPSPQKRAKLEGSGLKAGEQLPANTIPKSIPGIQFQKNNSTCTSTPSAQLDLYKFNTKVPLGFRLFI